MSYQSLQFIAFSGIVLLIYYAVSKKRQPLVPLLASLVFYALAGLKYLPFMLTTLFTSVTLTLFIFILRSMGFI